MIKDNMGLNLTTIAESWRVYVKKKYLFHICYRDEKLPSFLSNDSVIYIFGGHGASGSDSIGWPSLHENAINSWDIVKILLAANLNRYFKGRLKIYSCHSDESFSGAQSLGRNIAIKIKNLFRIVKFLATKEVLVRNIALQAID